MLDLKEAPSVPKAAPTLARRGTSTLAAPLLREGTAIGALLIRRDG